MMNTDGLKSLTFIHADRTKTSRIDEREMKIDSEDAEQILSLTEYNFVQFVVDVTTFDGQEIASLNMRLLPMRSYAGYV